MNLRDLRLRLRALFRPRDADRDLDDELAFHIDREAMRLAEQGVPGAEARRRARLHFGSVARTAEECRDARGIGLVETTGRDVAYALRTFQRAPLAAGTIVATVAIGLGLVAAAFTLFNMFAFRADHVRNPDELFSVERTRPAQGEWRPFTRADADALRRDTSVFAEVAAILPDITTRIDGRLMEGTLVSGNFFELVGVSAAAGRTLMPADDARLEGRRVIVLSHSGWTRLFANDPDVLGRELIVEGAPFRIVGVMPKGFRGLSIAAPDYWAPLEMLGQFRPAHVGREDHVGVVVITRLKKDVAPDAALAAAQAWAVNRGETSSTGPAIRIQPRQGTLPEWGEMLMVFTPLFTAFGLILLIGCVNVANLLLARAVARQREIGIRLALGASRRRILRQLLTENALLGLAAAGAGLLVSRLVLHGALSAAMSTMAPELAAMTRFSVPDADWRVAVFVVAAALVATMLFGLVPALQTSRLNVVRIARGELAGIARPGRARQFLIAVQVTASALLLISAAVFLRSTARAAALDPGLRTADTLVVGVPNEEKREAVIAAAAADPTVAMVAASWPDVVSPPRDGLASAVGVAARTRIGFRRVTPTYFDVLGIPSVRGRTFHETEPATAPVAVVSEHTARALWPSADAIGQQLHLEADPTSETRRQNEPIFTSRRFTVIGIVRDVPGFAFAGYAEAGIYLPADARQPDMDLVLRTRGGAEIARPSLEARLTTIDPNLGGVGTLGAVAGLGAYFLSLAFWLTVVLGTLALAFTVSGLFSVLSYLVEGRRREIAIRMALGSTHRGVLAEVLRQPLLPVALGLAGGAALAGTLAAALMRTPLGIHTATIVDLSDPLAYAGSLFCVVTASLLAVAVPAVRAVRIDPIRTLRHE